MATKAMSEMTDAELARERDYHLQAHYDWYRAPDHHLAWLHRILANQYDAELTRRREGKTDGN